MYFVTLADDELMAIADRIVRELAIEWFFNIQLVGDRVIEMQPRISTVVYQEDLNLPWLGVKRALGEVSDEELETMRTRVRPGRPRRFDAFVCARIGERSDAAHDRGRREAVAEPHSANHRVRSARKCQARAKRAMPRWSARCATSHGQSTKRRPTWNELNP